MTPRECYDVYLKRDEEYAAALHRLKRATWDVLEACGWKCVGRGLWVHPGYCDGLPCPEDMAVDVASGEFGPDSD